MSVGNNGMSKMISLYSILMFCLVSYVREVASERSF